MMVPVAVEEFDGDAGQAGFAGVLGAVAVVVSVDGVADGAEWLVAEVGGVMSAPGSSVTSVDESRVPSGSALLVVVEAGRVVVSTRML